MVKEGDYLVAASDYDEYRNLNYSCYKVLRVYPGMDRHGRVLINFDVTYCGSFNPVTGTLTEHDSEHHRLHRHQTWSNSWTIVKKKRKPILRKLPPWI